MWPQLGGGAFWLPSLLWALVFMWPRPGRERKRIAILRSSLTIDLSDYGCDQRCGTTVYLF